MEQSSEQQQQAAGRTKRTGSIRKNLQIDSNKIETDRLKSKSGEDDYNSLAEIEDLRCERLTDRTAGQPITSNLFKIIILGDTAVGKSCVMTRLMKDKFETEHNLTVGVDFGSCHMKVEETMMKLQIWDTAGQENFKSITKIFYRQANAVILVYSIDRMESFANL